MKEHPVGIRTRSTRPSYRRRTVAVVMASAMIIAACGSSDASKSTQPPSSSAAPAPSGSAATETVASADSTPLATLKIGTSLPMTGPVADVSKSGIEGYQLWAADVNASGGLLGHPVELKVLDNGFDQAQVSTDYTRLISDDKVDLLLGTFSSFLNGPASAVAARQKMLYVEPSGGASSLFEQGFTNLFLAQPGTSTSLPDRFIEWVKGLPDNDKPASAAYLTQDDPSAADAVANFQTGLEALGLKTVYDETYDPNLSNFDPLAAAVANAKPAMIIQGSVAADGAQFSRSLQKLKYNPSILFQVNSPSDQTYPDAVGTGNADGVFTALAWSAEATYPGNAEFVAAYTAKFGYAPSEDAANSYTAGQVLAAAVTAVGSIEDQEALSTWLHANTVQTIVGPLKWDATGVPEGSLLLGQWQAGKLEILAPASAATSQKVVTPKPAWVS